MLGVEREELYGTSKMRQLHKSSLSNAVMSPAALPTQGKRRTVNGLFRRNASVPQSCASWAIFSGEVFPGIGTVSSPMPQQVEYTSRSPIVYCFLPAAAASPSSSSAANISPENPTKSQHPSPRDLKIRVRNAQHSIVPLAPKCSTPSSST